MSTQEADREPAGIAEVSEGLVLHENVVDLSGRTRSPAIQIAEDVEVEDGPADTTDRTGPFAITHIDVTSALRAVLPMAVFYVIAFCVGLPLAWGLIDSSNSLGSFESVFLEAVPITTRMLVIVGLALAACCTAMTLGLVATTVWILNRTARIGGGIEVDTAPSARG